MHLLRQRAWENEDVCQHPFEGAKAAGRIDGRNFCTLLRYYRTNAPKAAQFFNSRLSLIPGAENVRIAPWKQTVAGLKFLSRSDRRSS